MAKPASVLIKMVSTADTGYFYVKKKNTRTSTEKLEMRKYERLRERHETCIDREAQKKKKERMHKAV